MRTQKPFLTVALSVPTTKVNTFLMTLFGPSASLASWLYNDSQCPLQKSGPVNGVTKSLMGALDI